MKRHLNLIPPGTRHRQTLKRMVRVGSRSIVVAGVGLGLLLAAEWTRGLGRLARLQELEARFAPLSRLVHEQAAMAEKIEKLRAREQLSLRLSRDEYGLALLGAISVAASESAGSVYLKQLEYQANTTTIEPITTTREVRIDGASVDGIGVATFAERLRISQVFDSVAVESTTPMPGGLSSLRRFEIHCAF